MKPTLLFYGNCQAAALSVIFRADAAIAAAFDVRHIPNFDDRIPDAERTGLDSVAASTVFFDQHDAEPFPHLDVLPAGCIRVSYPSVDFNLLWPLTCVNIYNDSSTPEFPWGHFPYGDRVVVDAVKAGEAAADIIAAYPDSSRAHLPNMSRFAKLEFARLQSRDAKCDVTIGDFVLGTFRDRNLFWAVNHPTSVALAELSKRLIDAVGTRSAALQTARIPETLAMLDPEGPLSFFHDPVHPAIAEHFNLRWYPYNAGADYGIRGHRMTYDAYYAAMIEASVRERDVRLERAS